MGAGTVVPESLRSDADDSSVAATSRARRRAAELGVNLTTVAGSGPRGRVSVDDIHRAVVEHGGRVEVRSGGLPAGGPR